MSVAITKSCQSIKYHMGSFDRRCEQLYKIKNKSKETVQFVPHRIQKQIEQKILEVKNNNKPVRIIILKPRQIGCTTYFCIRNFDRAYLKRNQFNAIIAHKQKSIKTIFTEIVKFSYDNLPPELKFKATNDSVTQLHWRNIGSQILVTMDGHGITPNRLHVTEVAHMQKAKEVIGEALQGVPLHGEVVLESTANGEGGYYHSTWVEAINNPSDSIWTPIFLKWFHQDEYWQEPEPDFKLTDEEEDLLNRFKDDGMSIGNLVWRRLKIKELGGNKVDVATGLSGKMLFMQNYPSDWLEAFIIRGNSLFNVDALHHMALNRPTEEQIITRQVGSGIMRVFRNKEDKCQYLISCDPSYGEAGCFSAVTVFEKATRRIVATLHGKYVPNALAKHLKNLGNFYNNALVAIERNTGHVIINELLNHLDYFNLYYHVEYDGNGQSRKRPGFPTTTATRNLILGHLEDAISEREILIPDENYISELRSFGNVNGKWKAISGNDDRVMSLAIGNHLCLQSNMSLGLTAQKPAGL